MQSGVEKDSSFRSNFFFLKELEGSLSCTSSPLDPMREGEHWVPACPPACLPAALNCTHGARYSSQECVFLQMIKSIQFWQDLLEHASLFYAIPSPSSGAFITLPACQLMEIVLSPHLIEGRGYDARCPQFSSDAEVCACVWGEGEQRSLLGEGAALLSAWQWRSNYCC